MNKKYLVIVFIVFAVCIVVNPCRVFAETLEIGDENIWIILKANGPVPTVTTYKASGPRGELGVPIIITDPKGRKMGFDPRIGKWITEFDVSYDVFKEGPVDMTEETEYLYLNDPKFREEYEADSSYVLDIAFNLMPGDYIVETLGERLTEYKLGIAVTHRIKGQPKKYSNLDFTGIIDKDRTAKFKITYNPDPASEPGSGVRIATPSSLKQDITLSRKIGWIDNDGIMKSLLGKAGAIEASIAKGNKEAAKNQLTAFINEVNAQKGKHIADKAVKIFLEDAKYLMESL